MNRRTFLKRGFLGGAILALGGGATLSFLPSRRLLEPARALLVLDERAFQVLVAIARRVVTAPEADHLEIAHGVDEALSRAVPEAQADLTQLLGHGARE